MREHTIWEIRSPLAPDRVIAAPIEFTDDRARIWRETSHPDVYRVHARGPTWMEVTEGIPRAWSRGRHDWSAPGIVALYQLDSNIAEPGGLIVYRIDADGNGSTVRCERLRSFRVTRAGRLAAVYMRPFVPRILCDQFAAGLRRIGD